MEQPLRLRGTLSPANGRPERPPQAEGLPHISSDDVVINWPGLHTGNVFSVLLSRKYSWFQPLPLRPMAILGEPSRAFTQYVYFDVATKAGENASATIPAAGTRNLLVLRPYNLMW